MTLDIDQQMSCTFGGPVLALRKLNWLNWVEEYTSNRRPRALRGAHAAVKFVLVAFVRD
jgi:hypothetical protein